MMQQSAMKKYSKTALTPKLRFPEFQYEPWQEKLIGDFLQESRIKGSSGKIARKLTVKLWGKGVCEKIESMSGSENTQYYRRKAGQFIYSKLDFLNQAFGIIPPELDGLESTTDLPCFDVSSELHPNFLLEYVKRPSFYKKFGEIADGGRKAKRIQPESFLSFPICIPRQFAEQQKIAECLSSLDELIEAERRKLDALKAHKKGLMQQLFPREGETRPRLRFPEFRDAPEWESKTVDDLVDTITPPKKLLTSDYRPAGQFPVIDQSQDYICGWTDDEEAVIDDDLPVVVFGDHTCALKFVDRPFAQGADGIKILKAKADVRDDFLFYSLQANPVQQESYKRHFSTLRERVVAFPDKDSGEQRRIAACVSSLDDLIAAQSERLEALRAHKRGLMQQLFPNPSGFES